MSEKIVAILTGDIVNSRSEDPEKWMIRLKAVLNETGKSPESWEIFRGDTFQLETTVQDALKKAIQVKASIKQDKNLDVRIAIGIGKQEYKKESITESNGEAYIHSGSCFNELKKRRLAIKTPWPEFDEEWNLYIKLASLSIDQLAPKTAAILKAAMDHPEMNQQQLADQLQKNQSTISESLNRAGFDELQSMLNRYQNQIEQKINQ